MWFTNRAKNKAISILSGTLGVSLGLFGLATWASQRFFDMFANMMHMQNYFGLLEIISVIAAPTLIAIALYFWNADPKETAPLPAPKVSMVGQFSEGSSSADLEELAEPLIAEKCQRNISEKEEQEHQTSKLQTTEISALMTRVTKLRSNIQNSQEKEEVAEEEEGEEVEERAKWASETGPQWWMDG